MDGAPLNPPCPDSQAKVAPVRRSFRHSATGEISGDGTNGFLGVPGRSGFGMTYLKGKDTAAMRKSSESRDMT